MVMSAALRQFTVQDVDALPADGNRYEVLHGVLLVTPQAGLPHQSVATKLTVALSSFLQAEPEIEVWAPGAIRIQPAVHLEPDVLVGRLPTTIARWEAVHDHWLAVEVSGKGSRIYDREYKRDGYLGVGVAEVWLVDLDAKRIFVSRPGGPKDIPHAAELIWRSPGGRELRLDVAALFLRVPAGE